MNVDIIKALIELSSSLIQLIITVITLISIKDKGDK